MPTAPPVFWLTQFAILLVWGLTWFLFPATTLSLLAGKPVAELSSGAIDQLRMSAPYLLGHCGFTLFAMMTRRTRMKRGMASVFALMFGLWGVVNIAGIWLGEYGLAAIPFALIPIGLSLGNLGLAIPTPPHWAVAEDAGDSSTKPPFAFFLWVIQGTTLFVGAMAFLMIPRTVLSLISGEPAESLTFLAVHQTSLLGAISIGMGLLSGLAVYVHSSFAWRGFAWFFAVFFSLWTLSIGWILVWGNYALPVLQVLLPGLIFLPANIWVFRMRGEFDPGDVQRHSDSWTPLDLWAGPLMALSVLRTGRRSSHLIGVAAKGVFHPGALLARDATSISNETSRVPANEFFQQIERPVIVRFANLTQLDDASLDVRGCAVKFSQHPVESPFDLLMNTGSYCPADTIVAFASFVLSKFLPVRIVEKATRRNPVAREGGVAGLRRAPASYGGLNYYGQIIRYWSDPDGRRYLVRYRCRPDDTVFPKETGLPDAEDASHVWLRDRLQTEDRPSDYLRQELKDRIQKEPIRMNLQAQFHLPESGDSEEWYNPSVDWDEQTHPWMDLGQIELDETLPDAEAEVLQFNPGNHPECLGIPSSTGPFGYRSMGESEVRVVNSLARMRVWMYGQYGLPAFGRVSEQ